jgi:Winged helix DNA-binding domain
MRRMESLTWAQVRARRLARSYLHEPAPLARLGEVVGEVCGIHAQVASSAELQLQACVAGVDVRAELWEKRSLVKSYGPRGTLHLLARDEVPLWAAANEWEVEAWYERHGFTRRKADAIVAAVGKALDGCELTRAELAAEVGGKDPRVRELLGSGWAYLLGPAAAKGLLCFGPPRGAAVTFVRADHWLGCWDERDPEDRIAGLWERKAGRVAVEAFERLPKRALEAEAHRLGGEVELRVLE